MGHSGANLSIACSTWLCISEFGAVGKCNQGEQYPQCKLSLSKWGPPLRRAKVCLPNQILDKLLKSHLWRREWLVVDWKAEIFAGVYWGYELSETQTARVYDVLPPFPTPLPKDRCFDTEKEFVSCYFLFSQKGQSGTPDLRQFSTLSAFLNGEEPTQWATPVTWKSCVQGHWVVKGIQWIHLNIHTWFPYSGVN